MGIGGGGGRVTYPLLELWVSRPGQMRLLPPVHEVVKEVTAGGGGRPQSARLPKLPMRRMACRSVAHLSSHHPTPYPPTFSHTLPHRCLQGPVSPGQLRLGRTAEAAGSTMTPHRLSLLLEGVCIGVWWLPCAPVCNTDSSLLEARAAGVHALLLRRFQWSMCCCRRAWL